MILPSFGRCLMGTAIVVTMTIAAPSSSFAQGACSSSTDAFLNPFTYKSAHHRPIGTGARYADNNHAATKSWRRAAHFNFNVGGPWGVDVADVTASDPQVQINSRVIGPDGGYGLPVTIKVPRNGFKTNVSTNQSGNTDGVAVIVDRTNWQAHQLRQYNWNNGKPTAAQYRNWSVRGLGHGTKSGERIGTSASGVAAMFGILRGHEINKAGNPIEHALQIVLPRTNSSSCNVMLSREIRLPATSGDKTANQAGNNTGSIPYGALLALPQNININSLGLSEPGRRLAEAIRNYGIYVVDGGGCQAGAIRTDQFVNSQVINQLKNDVKKIYPHIRMVLNNDVLGTQVAGGGQPLAPNCAFDAPSAQRTAASAPQSGSGNSGSSNTGGGSSGGSKASASEIAKLEQEVKQRQAALRVAEQRHAAGLIPLKNVQDRRRELAAAEAALSKAKSGTNTASNTSGGNSNQQASQQQSASSGGSSKPKLSWSAVKNANNYYVEVRDTTKQRAKVYGKMVPPKDGGCVSGGTCSHLVPSLSTKQGYQWTYRAVVNGKPQSFANWRPVP